MKVPFVDLASEHEPLREALAAATAEVLASGRYVLGERLAAFETAFATYVGASHAVGVSSGTDALMLALRALGVGPSDVVVTTPYSFYSSAAVVLQIGAEVAFVDIDPETDNVSPAAFERFLEDDPRAERTKVVLPVHLFGLAADVAQLSALAERHDIAVVEDAAQAIGTYDTRGHHAGTAGRLGCFSFFPTKNLGGFGDGGAVVTNDPELADTVRRLRSYGAAEKLVHVGLGGNHRLDELQAALLAVKLPHLDAANARRAAHAAAYDAALADLEIRAPQRALAPARHAYHQYVVHAPDRDRLRARLAEDEIDTAVYYPLPLHRQPCFGPYVADHDLPAADAAAETALALPIRPSMTDEMRNWVVDRLRVYGA